jgi:hypothetical protein
MSDALELSDARRKLVEQWLRKGRAKDTGVVGPRPADAPHLLSFQQERMLAAERVVPGVPFRNQSALLRVLGELRKSVLEDAVSELIRRHENFRTRFPVVGGERVPVVDPPGHFSLRMTSLRHLAPDAGEQRCVQIYEEHLKTPMSLSDGPLFHIQVFELAGGRSMLHLVIDHLLFDGWSFGIVLAELSTLYADAAASRPFSLPDLGIQYADFAWHQRAQLSGGHWAPLDKFWRDTLAGDVPRLELPTDFPRSQPQGFAIGMVPFSLGEELSGQIRRFAARARVSVFSILLSGFYAMVHQYTKHTDLAVVTPVEIRTGPELHALIGNLTNHIVLRGDLQGNPSFAEVVDRTHSVVIRAKANAGLPISHVLSALASQREPGWTSPFRLMLVLQNYPMPQMSLGGIPLELLHVDYGTALYDLNLLLVDDHPELAGPVKFNARLFEQSTVEGFLAAFRALLSEGLANPGAAVSKLVVPC